MDLENVFVVQFKISIHYDYNTIERLQALDTMFFMS